jgi:hypothetical protein
MNLSDIDAVVRLCEERKTLNRHYDEIYEHKNNVLGVTIRGTYQDDRLVNAVRPIVLDDISARIREIDKCLLELNVRADQ